MKLIKTFITLFIVATLMFLAWHYRSWYMAFLSCVCLVTGYGLCELWRIKAPK